MISQWHLNFLVVIAQCNILASTEADSHRLHRTDDSMISSSVIKRFLLDRAHFSMTLAVSISATMCYSSLKFSKDFNAQKDRRQKAVSFYLGNDLNKSYQSFTCYLFSLELRSYYRPPEHNCLKPQLSNRNKSQIVSTVTICEHRRLGSNLSTCEKLTLVAEPWALFLSRARTDTEILLWFSLSAHAFRLG